jgi:hypothetical protein
MKAYGGMDVYIHVFLILTLCGGEWSDSRPGRFIPTQKPPVTIGQEVGWTPEPVWTTWREKFFILPGLELRPLGRPARSHSLYRLYYPTFGNGLKYSNPKTEEGLFEMLITIYKLYGVTSRKNVSLILIAVRVSSLTECKFLSSSTHGTPK